MNILAKPAHEFYDGRTTHLRNGQKQFISSMANTSEEGREIILLAYKRLQIKDALKHSYQRRTYSSAYIHRCKDEKGRLTGHMTLDTFEQLGPRWVDEAHKINKQLPGGYYTDDFDGETYTGVVLCFTRHGGAGLREAGHGDDNFDETKPKGRVVYMAGIRHSSWDGVTLDLSVTDNANTAARWADSMAEREAEACRIEDEKYQREQQVAELRGQVAEARKNCLKLLRDMRPIRKGLQAFPESVCEALRNQVEEYCQDIAGWRTEIKELT